MLNEAQPALLDRLTSHAIDNGHGWQLPVEVVLRHRHEPAMDISIGIGEDEAIVAWLSTHEHVYDGPEHGEQSWTTVVVDTVAAVLRGQYEVEETYKGDRLVKSRVIDRHDGRTISTTGVLLWPLIPQRSRRLEPRRLEYACADSQPRTSP